MSDNAVPWTKKQEQRLRDIRSAQAVVIVYAIASVACMVGVALYFLAQDNTKVPVDVTGDSMQDTSIAFVIVAALVLCMGTVLRGLELRDLLRQSD